MEAACLKNEDPLPLQLMFQDEARFGRMSDPLSCWAPAPHRPVVNLALVREFRYEYAAVSPWDGALDFMTAEKMNTENSSLFLGQVSEAHKEEFITRGLEISFNYGGTNLRNVREVSFFAGKHPYPKVARKKVKGIKLKISEDEWIFPNSGVAFI